MPKQCLDGSDIVTALQQVGGKAMSEGVRADFFCNSSLTYSGFDGFINHAGVNVMPPDTIAARVL